MPERDTFYYHDRKQRKTLVCIPGWAYDCRIFAGLDAPFNYLMASQADVQAFSENLIAYLRDSGIAGVSLLGWSMGAFLAASFAARYPRSVDELILVSARRRYEPQNIKNIRNLVKKNRKAYLYTFYKQCFCGSDRMAWFRAHLLKAYADKFDLDCLCRGLRYLEHAEINAGALAGIQKIKIIHGEGDAVAPIEEAAALKHDLPQAELICISNAGHLPFLSRDFNRCFDDG